jgi:hypothetical protein
MSFLRSLIAKVVDGSKVPRAEIAEAVGELYSTFNRQVNPNDNIRFPAEGLVPLIKITGDQSILRHLVSETSDVTRLLLVEDRIKWGRDPAALPDLNIMFGNFQKAITQWVHGAPKSDASELIDQIDRLRAELVAIRSMVKKGKWQREFQFSPQRHNEKRGGR